MLKLLTKGRYLIMNLDNLRHLLNSRGDKQKLSEKTGISTGNISDWFNPNRKSTPSAESLIKIADYFECSVDYILGRTDIPAVNGAEPNYSDNIIHLFDIGEIIEIGTYKEPVSAGNGNIIENSSKFPQIYPQTKISSQADYCVKVSGYSMYPLYEDGDVLFVKKISENEIKNGDIGIFYHIDDSVCKRYNLKDGVKTLISENEDYKPRIVLPQHEYRVQGKVIGKFHID